MTSIVASLLVDSIEECHVRARRAFRKGADLVEYRIDRLRDPAEVEALVRTSKVPCMVACRVPEDGGHFEGDPDLRRQLLWTAAAAGATWVDVEHWDTLELPASSGTKLLRSYHRFTSAPRDLERIVDRMAASGADALKVTLRAYDSADLDLVEGLYKRDFGVPLTAFLAGEPGFASRFLAVANGAPFLYCRAESSSGTAPGQADVFEARELYRAATLAERGCFWGLAGSPIGHSLGVRLHNHLARHVPGVATYLPFETEEPERLLEVLRARGDSFLGLSVTAPLKRSVLPLCSELSPAAEACGAVNTLVFEGGVLRGDNTDVYGVRHAIAGALRSEDELQGKRALVLGGGGSARAAVLALEELGAEVVLGVRSRQHIRGFAAERGLDLVPIDRKAFASVDPAVVVHATPVGQGDTSGAEGACLLAARDLHRELLVLDLVYAPVWTPLLSRARAAGCRVVTGLSMFLHQAREQIRLVLGREAPTIAELRQLLGPFGREALHLSGDDADGR